MEPIRFPEAIEAARKAARGERAVDEGNEAGDGEGGNGELTGKQSFWQFYRTFALCCFCPSFGSTIALCS